MSYSQSQLPVIKQILSRGIELEHVLAQRSKQEPAFLWESSSEKNSPHARYQYLGLGAKTLLSVSDDCVHLIQGNQKQQIPLCEFENDPLEALRQLIQQEQLDEDSLNALRKDVELPPFIGGAVGFIAYDSARYFEKIDGARGQEGEPDLFFMVPELLVALDKDTKSISVISTNEARVAAFCAQFQELSVDSLAFESNSKGDAAYTKKFQAHDFIEKVEHAKEYIKAGDIFQVVLANTLELEKSPDPIEVYRKLKKHNPSPYHHLIRFGDASYLGASPEVFLRGGPLPHDVTKTGVQMRLVAGTYPMSDDSDENEKRIEALASDEKELAEHIMLVDHERNDIGRVSEIGSVKVSDLFSVESYSQVHHLVSQVSGVLREKEDLISAIRACFPIATLTGTPKIRAMEIIAELEGSSRGIFGGAVVALGVDGTIDSCVSIRGMTIRPEGTTVHVGAGIVDDSKPKREEKECLWKAEASLKAIRESRGGSK